MAHSVRPKLWPSEESPVGLDVRAFGTDRRGLLASFALSIFLAGRSLTIRNLTFTSDPPQRKYTMNSVIYGPPNELIEAHRIARPESLYTTDHEQMKWLAKAPRLDVSAWGPATHPTVQFVIETPDQPGIILNAARRVVERGGWFFYADARMRPRSIFRLVAYVIAPTFTMARELERDLIALRTVEPHYRTVEVQVIKPLLEVA